jgi:hypothetical protein
LFGYSRGGYTGLVLIGGNPDWAIPLCQRSSAAPICEQILRKEFRVEPLAHDPRIQAAVIADPFSRFFTRDGFETVTAQVELWASERGRRWSNTRERCCGGQKPAGKARVSYGSELRAFRFPDTMFTCTGESTARTLYRCARLRPRRLPQTVQCGFAVVLPDAPDAGTATVTTLDRPPTGDSFGHT